MKKIVVNARGFSIVQVMIAAGLMGGLSLVLMQLGDQQSKLKKTADMNHELVMLESRIQKVISSKQLCTVNFKDYAPGDILDGIKGADTRENEGYFIENGERHGQSIFVEEIELLSREDELDAGYVIDWGDSDDASERMPSTTLRMKIVYRFGAGEEKSQGFKAKRIQKIYDVPVVMGELFAHPGNIFDGQSGECETLAQTQRNSKVRTYNGKTYEVLYHGIGDENENACLVSGVDDIVYECQ